jgi:hypothetical protein
VGATGIEDAILAKTIDVGILLGHLKPILSGILLWIRPYVYFHVKNHWKDRKSISLIELKKNLFTVCRYFQLKSYDYTRCKRCRF